MWRPAERIKWQPDPGRWPSREEAAKSLLFSPLQVGALTLERAPGHRFDAPAVELLEGLAAHAGRLRWPGPADPARPAGGD